MSSGVEAWHEAGHALAAYLQGGVIREVTLESDRAGFEAHVAVEWTDLSADKDAYRLATVALAGPVAELVFTGAGIVEDEGVLFAWRDDWDDAQAQLERLAEDEEECERLRRQILAELYRDFSAPNAYERLARIADALEAHETLDEGLFLELMEE